MHKKRLRKKIGKKIKVSKVRYLTITTRLAMAALAAAASCNCLRIQSQVGMPRITKSLLLAEAAISFTQQSAKAWEKVTKAKRISADDYYRMKYRYPT